MKIKFVLLIWSLLNVSIFFAQDARVTGKISNIDNVAVENASIVLYINEAIKGYTYSNNLGEYTVNIKKIKSNDTLKITVNSLGYKNLTQIFLYNQEKEIIRDFVLEEKVEELNEVVLEAWEKIKVEKDTITFRAASYTDGSEQVVEDLLKNLPGVEILNNGNIKVNGRFIDKLLIEGDDLFDEKYKLLSKNLDAKNISEVQILNNFEENPVLRSFQESDKVALNLKLKEDKKNVWFGNMGLGLGTDKRYRGSGNVGLLKKKVKLFNLTSLNNTQKLTAPQIRGGGVNISGFQTKRKIEKINNEPVNIDNLSSSNFSQNEDVFNDSFLNSLSFVTNLSKDTKLRSLSYYAQDRIKKQNSVLVQYFTPGTIEYFEQRSIDLKDILFGTELEIKHYSKNGTYLTYDLSLESNPAKKNGHILSNNNQVIQTQNDTKHNLLNHLNITKKLDHNKLLSIYAYHGRNNTRQDYTLVPNVFDINTGEEDSLSTVEQNSGSPLSYTGLVAEMIAKYKKSELGLELSGNFDDDDIESTLFIDNAPPIDSLSNNTNYKKLRLEATLKHVYNISEVLKFKSSVRVSQNRLDLNGNKQRFLFINPKIGLNYKQKGIGVLGINYSYANNLPNIQYLNENYILRNYRTFSRGLNSIVPSKNHNIGLLYTFKSYKKLLLVNSFFQYSFSNINYGSESFVNEFSSFNRYTILDGGDFLNFNLGISTYLKNLPISVKLGTQQSLSNNNVSLNNTFGRVKNYSSNYRFQGTTYLNIPLNFKFHAQYNYSQGEFNGQKNSNGYIQASLTSTLELSKRLSVRASNNYYSINPNNFFFTDIEINLNPEKSRWSYRLVGSNLSNLSRFSNIYITDYQSSESSFDIVPRYILLDLKYRF